MNKDGKLKYELRQAKNLKELGLEFLKNNSSVKFRQTSDEFKAYIIEVPKEMLVFYSDQSVLPNKVVLTGMEKEVNVNTLLSSIEIVASGPIVANGKAADISVVFPSEVQQSSIISAGRKIELTFMKDAKADLDMQIMTGEIISEFKLDLPKTVLEGKRNVRTAVSKLNGGGNKVKIIGHTIVLKQPN